MRMETVSGLKISEASRSEILHAVKWYLVRSALRKNAVAVNISKKHLQQILRTVEKLDRLLSVGEKIQTDAHSLISESLNEIMKSNTAGSIGSLQYITTAVGLLTSACEKALKEKCVIGSPTGYGDAWNSFIESLDEWGRSEKLKMSLRKDSDKSKGERVPHPYFRFVDALLVEIPKEFRPDWHRSKDPKLRLEAVIRHIDVARAEGKRAP
jgi:hypothetical protein